MTRPGRLRRRAEPPGSRVIVALDVGQLGEALDLGRQLRGVVRRVKIGSALFTAVGPEAIAKLRSLGFDVFLDLKFHDIPSTVEKSCRAAVRHGAWMLTVHASGQREMLEAAAAGVREEAKRLGVGRPLVVGVTVLTSIGGQAAAVARRAVALAREAKAARLDGVVASVHEAAAIRRMLGPKLQIVCPGIRLPSADVADQQRVATPAEAIARGADFLVIGRPITGAPDPRASAQAIIRDMEREADVDS